MKLYKIIKEFLTNTSDLKKQVTVKFFLLDMNMIINLSL